MDHLLDRPHHPEPVGWVWVPGTLPTADTVALLLFGFVAFLLSSSIFHPTVYVVELLYTLLPVLKIIPNELNINIKDTDMHISLAYIYKSTCASLSFCSLMVPAIRICLLQILLMSNKQQCNHTERHSKVDQKILMYWNECQIKKFLKQILVCPKSVNHGRRV